MSTQTVRYRLIDLTATVEGLEQVRVAITVTPGHNGYLGSPITFTVPPAKVITEPTAEPKKGKKGKAPATTTKVDTSEQDDFIRRRVKWKVEQETGLTIDLADIREEA